MTICRPWLSRSTFNGRLVLLISGRLFFFSLLAVCLGCPLKTSPPDLKGCTRIEVRYGPGALDYFFPSTSMQNQVLGKEERAYVASFDTWTLTDQEQIRTFAERIRQGRYRGRQSGVIEDTQADIVCYQGSRRVASFAVHCLSIVTARKRRFTYPPHFLSLSLRNLAPPAIKPLRLRWECAMNLSRLVFEGLWPGRDRRLFPDPNRWCDVILEAYRRPYIIREELNGKRERMYPDSGIARTFTCPGAHAPPDANDAHFLPDETDSPSQARNNWVSDYAMNSNCRKDSPDDTVFLFESRPGWNQHGGPELFTFANHEPRGGNVLLRGGTLKFIRSEEELHQLRWK
jgi:hypothetical protein